MNITAYVSAQRTWSRLTFGDGRRTIGITKHIEKELAEIRAKPDDLEEWLDVIILAIDGYWRAGGKALDLARRLKEKQEINFNRRWPSLLPEDETTDHLINHFDDLQTKLTEAFDSEVHTAGHAHAAESALMTLQNQVKEMCICEHPRTRHPLINHSDSCLVPTCRCASFREKLA